MSLIHQKSQYLTFLIWRCLNESNILSKSRILHFKTSLITHIFNDPPFEKLNLVSQLVLAVVTPTINYVMVLF